MASGMAGTSGQRRVSLLLREEELGRVFRAVRRRIAERPGSPHVRRRGFLRTSLSQLRAITSRLLRIAGKGGDMLSKSFSAELFPNSGANY
jgi:hypothetical protein